LKTAWAFEKVPHQQSQMIYRDATVADIGQLMRVRLSVKENVLSNVDLVTPKDCEEYITQRGKGWVCETNGLIVGFAIADLQDHSIWALFVQPEWEGKDIGKRLHAMMLDWYFLQTSQTVWLTTAPQSRAEIFYRKHGWQETGRKPNGEIIFEMAAATWKQHATPTF
jgi:GNAT superfamily N-acetyltransferase